MSDAKLDTITLDAGEYHVDELRRLVEHLDRVAADRNDHVYEAPAAGDELALVRGPLGCTCAECAFLRARRR